MLLFVFAGGCGTPEPDRGAEQPGTEMGDVQADPLRLSLVVSGRVRAGDPVPITLQVKNSGDEPIDLHLRGRPVAFDIVVEGPDGSEVWRRLEGQTVPAILQVKTLAPGESLELHAEWGQRNRDGAPVAPGSYTVRGSLPVVQKGPLETPPARLHILPRNG